MAADMQRLLGHRLRAASLLLSVKAECQFRRRMCWNGTTLRCKDCTRLGTALLRQTDLHERTCRHVYTLQPCSMVFSMHLV